MICLTLRTLFTVCGLMNGALIWKVKSLLSHNNSSERERECAEETHISS